MTSLISWPFRLASSGAVAVADDGSEEYMAEELAQVLQTKPGERVLVEEYGMEAGPYDEVDAAVLATQVSLFGPPVRVTEVRATWVGEGRQDVVVVFDPEPEPGDDGYMDLGMALNASTDQED